MEAGLQVYMAHAEDDKKQTNKSITFHHTIIKFLQVHHLKPPGLDKECVKLTISFPGQKNQVKLRMNELARRARLLIPALDHEAVRHNLEDEGVAADPPAQVDFADLARKAEEHRQHLQDERGEAEMLKRQKEEDAKAKQQAKADKKSKGKGKGNKKPAAPRKRQKRGNGSDEEEEQDMAWYEEDENGERALYCDKDLRCAGIGRCSTVATSPTLLTCPDLLPYRCMACKETDGFQMLLCDGCNKAATRDATRSTAASQCPRCLTRKSHGFAR